MNTIEKIINQKDKQFYQLQYAFLTIKNYHLISNIKQKSFHNLTSKSAQSHSMHSIEIENKELYLNYIEQALKKKQLELLQFEEHLHRKHEEDEQQRINQKIINPLAINHFAQLLTKKIQVLKEIIIKCSVKPHIISAERQLDNFNNNLSIVQEACRKNYEILQAQMIKDYEALNNQKHEYALKLSKLNELESYEKYLNQFQMALQRKQNEIIIRQKQVQKINTKKSQAYNQTSHQQKMRIYEQQNTYNDGEFIQMPNDQSVRKRVKIFQNKNIESKDKDKTSDLQIKIASSMIESSKIMKEAQTNEYSIQKKSVKFQTQKIPKGLQSQVQDIHKDYQSIGSQTFIEHSSNKLDIESHYLKYLRLWLIFSRRNSKGDLKHKKTMSLYLWRLNALYDNGLKQRIEQNLSWPKKIYKINHIQNINYEDLSLKKRKYLQKFFQHEKKSFHRQKIIFFLKNILKNRNRRQRTAVVLYFRKYKHNTQILKLIYNKKQALSERSFDSNHQNPIKMQDIKILSKSTFHKNQNNEKHNEKLINKSKIQNNLGGSSNNSKSKLLKDANIDMNKLRQYIRNQEQVQIKLAIECYKTSATFRMQHTLFKAVNKLNYCFLFNIMKITETNKINALQKSINSAQFKWQLFMAKARLAITNNANKISHLQQLISFV